jgi:hypothetical protein
LFTPEPDTGERRHERTGGERDDLLAQQRLDA